MSLASGPWRIRSCPRLLRVGGLVAALGVTATGWATVDGIRATWAPILQVAGTKNEVEGIDNLRGAVAIATAMIHNVHTDPATTRFLRKSQRAVDDFNLETMHQTLPQQRGEWRQLALQGSYSTGKYYVSTPRSPDFEVSAMGPRNMPGDTSVVLRMRAADSVDDLSSYLIQMRGGIGLGKWSWADAMRGLSLAMLLLEQRGEGGEMILANRNSVKQALALNPKLAPREAGVVGLVWDAFPNLSRRVADLFALDRLIGIDAADCREVDAILRVDPKRLKSKFPSLSDYLQGLDDLLVAKIRWLDRKGRLLFTAQINSENLTIRFRFFVARGRLLPWTRGNPVPNDAVDPLGEDLDGTRVVIDAALRVIGLTIEAKRMEAHLLYQPRQSVANVALRITTVPRTSVAGSAYGLLPTGLIDLFIPGNLDELVHDFMSIAATGNGRRGIAAAAQIGQIDAGQPTTFEGTLGFEALDSLLVSWGVGIVRERALPGEDARAEAELLLAEAVEAFSQDVERYAAREPIDH